MAAAALGSSRGGAEHLMGDDLDELSAIVARVTRRMCARWPSDADDIRQEALLAVLSRPAGVTPGIVAKRAGIDYLRRIYGRPGGSRICGAHVATAGQLSAAEHVTGPTAPDPAELADPALTWGLAGRLEFVARALAAGWPKWRVAEACGVTAGQVSRACAVLREVA
jgi:DNA-directed RNA polymerase specialized sigma24 family protein